MNGKLTGVVILTIIFTCQFSTGYKSVEENYSDIEKYKKSDIPAEFLERFKNDNDKKDFKRLREFLSEKEDLVEAINSEIKNYSEKSKDISMYSDKIDKLQILIANKKLEFKVSIKPDILYVSSENESLLNRYGYLNTRIYNNENIIRTVQEIKDIIAKYNKIKNDLEDETKIHQFLISNKKVVKQDIYYCRSQIDSTLAPEYKQQEFRTSISICFTVLIGLLLTIFFFIVFKKSDNNLSKELLSGNGLQFITLFVLIIAVILFGILSILQGSELAAILAGISGYILGKGTPNITKPNSKNNNTLPSDSVN